MELLQVALLILLVEVECLKQLVEKVPVIKQVECLVVELFGVLVQLVVVIVQVRQLEELSVEVVVVEVLVTTQGNNQKTE